MSSSELSMSDNHGASTSRLAVPPPSFRAHSFNSSVYGTQSRKPRRSSPLAGPSLSVERLATDTLASSSKPKPTRVLSSPELGDTWKPRPTSMYAAMPKAPASPKPSSSRKSFYLGTSTQSDNASVTSANSTARAHSPQQHKQGTPETRKGLDTLSVARPRTSDESSDNWLVSNTYATTPRFSRLSLAAPGVVMPTSAKEARRMSRAPSAATLNSLLSSQGEMPTSSKKSSVGGSYSQSVPSLSLSRTDSFESSVRSSAESVSLHMPPGTSVSAVSLTISTLVQEEDKEKSIPVVSSSSVTLPSSVEDAKSGRPRRRGSLSNLASSIRRSFKARTSPKMQSFLNSDPYARPDEQENSAERNTDNDHKPKRSASVKRLWRSLSVRSRA